MREIKFRGFIDGSMIDWVSIQEDYDLLWIIKQPIIMQYTGLKDKNGKEIYEGDIVKMTDDDNQENICEVTFINGGFLVEWDSNFFGGEADLTTIGWAIEEGIEVEIIGNIYENPELLS